MYLVVGDECECVCDCIPTPQCLNTINAFVRDEQQNHFFRREEIAGVQGCGVCVLSVSVCLCLCVCL